MTINYNCKVSYHVELNRERLYIRETVLIILLNWSMFKEILLKHFSHNIEFNWHQNIYDYSHIPNFPCCKISLNNFFSGLKWTRLRVFSVHHPLYMNILWQHSEISVMVISIRCIWYILHLYWSIFTTRRDSHHKLIWCYHRVIDS